MNGTALYYESAGSGTPLVLIHGNTLDSRMWDDQFDVFAEHYRVLRYDMRGFGRSQLPSDTAYSPAADLKALLHHLEVDQAYVLGLSRGGLVAVDFAIAYPEAVRSLILVDAGLRAFDWQTFGQFSESVRATARTSGLQDAKNRWLNGPLFAPALEQAEVAERLAAMVADYLGWQWLNDEQLDVSEQAPSDQLQHILAPTLVVIGERDIPDFQSIARLLATGIANSELHTLMGSGTCRTWKHRQSLTAWYWDSCRDWPHRTNIAESGTEETTSKKTGTRESST
ncbi:MAG: alpha/beta hydrolase [Pseudomonadota bacterium]